MNTRKKVQCAVGAVGLLLSRAACTINTAFSTHLSYSMIADYPLDWVYKNSVSHYDVFMKTTGRCTSDILTSIITDTQRDGDISVNDILQMLGERAFGLAILIFALPNSLPIPSPPGLSAITGILIIVLAMQMILGRDVPWLPARIGNYRFSRTIFCAFLARALPYIRKIERLLHPRLCFMHSRLGERMTGVAFLILGMVLSLPIPFGNFLPGVSMTLIALGLLERDGATMAGGMLGGIVTCVGMFIAIETIARSALSALSF